MMERVTQKIEHIRTLPEHIRLRYALGAVIVCMVFVVGIWFLTLKQGLNDVSPEVSSGKEQVEENLSNLGEGFPDTNSLETLKQNSESLRVNNPTDDAETFLNQEIERKNTSPTETPVTPQEAQ